MRRPARASRAGRETAAAFSGVTVADLLRVQRAIHEHRPRYSARSGGKAGRIVAEVLGLDATADQRRLRRLIDTWIGSNALRKVELPDATRTSGPCLKVGEWADE